MLDRAVAVLGLVLIAVAASPGFLGTAQDGQSAQFVFGLAVMLCGSTAVLVASSGILQRMTNGFRWLSPLALLAAGLKTVFQSARICSAVFALSLLIHVISAIGLWTALLAFGQEIPFLSVLAVFAPVILVQMLPISLGGWGVRELMAVPMFAMIGVAAPQALAASIVAGLLAAISILPGSLAWFVRRQGAAQ